MMQQRSHEDIEATWHEVFTRAEPSLRQVVFEEITESAVQLADRFYDRLLGDERAVRFLDSALVNQRLHASMGRWLCQLFDPAVTPGPFIEIQHRVGEVHARIGVSIALVGEGARTLRRAIAAGLSRRGLAPDELAGAIQYVYEAIDIAIDTMNAAYVRNAARMTRNDEAYRMIFLTQDMKAERERQRSELLEWAQRILMHYYWEPASTASGAEVADDFHHSQFGMWLQHKASLLFDGAPEIESIRQHIEVIERQLLPELTRLRGSTDGARPVVTSINQHIEAIKSLLSLMFDRFIEGEDGRDSVTRLLNRRYIPSVTKREIELARHNRSVFSVLMIDIDRFDALRDIGGFDAIDAAVAQVAQVLTEHTGAGDFLFRLGDARFLVLLVEHAATQAMQTARVLCEQANAMTIRVPQGVSTTITLSIGLADFDGHPDYQYLLDRAQDALDAVLRDGGNQVRAAA